LPSVFASEPVVPAPELKRTSVAKAAPAPAKRKRIARVQREAKPPGNTWAYSPHGEIFGDSNSLVPIIWSMR
jgi:hypothetical protein